MEGIREMPAFAHRHRSSTNKGNKKTKGLILNGGWRYDLVEWFCDSFLFRGQMRKLRLNTISLANIQPGESVLDVGCGTGTLAIEVQERLSGTGHVFGIDPGPQQIERARSKATRRKLPIDFQIGTIEQLAFPEQTFDVVLSTVMMHHLPNGTKRQGLTEIARILKPGGRLVIADFKHPKQRHGQAAHFHAGGSSVDDLVALVAEAGFVQVETEEMQPIQFSAFPGAGFIWGIKEEKQHMANSPIHPEPARSQDFETGEQYERSSATTPRWVKVSVIIAVILVLLFIIRHLTGASFGHQMHMSDIGYWKLFL